MDSNEDLEQIRVLVDWLPCKQASEHDDQVLLGFFMYSEVQRIKREIWFCFDPTYFRNPFVFSVTEENEV